MNATLTETNLQWVEATAKTLNVSPEALLNAILDHLRHKDKTGVTAMCLDFHLHDQPRGGIVKVCPLKFPVRPASENVQIQILIGFF